MAYPDKINNLVNVTGDQTLAAGGHAARHNDVNEALVEVKGALGGGDPVVAQSASTTPLVLKGASGQTANLLTVEDSGGTDFFVVTTDGNVGITTGGGADQSLAIRSDTNVVLSNVSDNSRSGIHIYNVNGTQGDGNFGAGISFSGIGTGRRRTLIASYQDGADPDPTGLVFCTYPFTSTASDEVREVSRMTSSGAMLLGTTSPGSASTGDLVVNGGVFLGGNAAANELDDYEEGTWTPTYTTDGTDFDAVTYDGSVSAFYTKIGRTVFFSFWIRTTSITVGAASGSILVSGLPFTCFSGAGVGDNFSVSISFARNFAGEVPSTARVLPSSNVMEVYYRSTSDGNTADLVVADLDTASGKNEMYVSGFYFTA